MKLLAATLVLATVSSVCLAAVDQQQAPSSQAAASAVPAQASNKAAAAAAPAQQQQHPTTSERQGRAISSSGNASNNLSNNGNSNIIEHQHSKKSLLEQERRNVQEFLTTKNIFKSIMKLLLGSREEVGATSRTVLGVLSQVLDIIKSQLGMRSRSGTARTIRDYGEDAASAGISMLQGYVKSVLAENPACAKRYLCEASREATRGGHDMGYVIATVGGYATSHMLDSARTDGAGNAYFDASLKGRQNSIECKKLYADCADEPLKN